MSDVATKSKRTKRIDPNGVPIKRMTLALSETDFFVIEKVKMFLTTGLFARALDIPKIDESGKDDEIRGRTVAIVFKRILDEIEDSQK